MNWEDNLITTSAQIRELLAETTTIAVLGIKTEAQANQPAFYVPKYMYAAGFKIIPVPVYYPDVTEILGQPVYRKVNDIPVEVDHGQCLSPIARHPAAPQRHSCQEAPERLAATRHQSR
jgi:predicted CoA-binding protein